MRGDPSRSTALVGVKVSEASVRCCTPHRPRAVTALLDGAVGGGVGELRQMAFRGGFVGAGPEDAGLEQARCGGVHDVQVVHFDDIADVDIAASDSGDR